MHFSLPFLSLRPSGQLGTLVVKMSSDDRWGFLDSEPSSPGVSTSRGASQAPSMALYEPFGSTTMSSAELRPWSSAQSQIPAQPRIPSPPCSPLSLESYEPDNVDLFNRLYTPRPIPDAPEGSEVATVQCANTSETPRDRANSDSPR
jgi:hypothetical protein